MTALGTPILLYHSIADDPSPRFARWAVSPRLFAEHMAYLADAGMRALTVSELASRLAEGEGPPEPGTVVITFDDGFQDLLTAGLPVLARHGLRATAYITTGYVGRTSAWLRSLGEGERKMLTWAQIRELRDAGVECGAHTRTHTELDTMPAAAALDEIEGSKAALEEHLGDPVTSFAYPHGYHDAEVRALVRRAGFASACAVDNALCTPSDDRFALRRVIVGGGTDVARFAALLRGEGLRWGRDRRVRRRVWRAVRRVRALGQAVRTGRPDW